MTAIQIIAIWGIFALTGALAGGILAAVKNRDHSAWAAWCFVFPPAVVALILLSRNPGPRPKRPSMDQDDDREQHLI